MENSAQKGIKGVMEDFVDGVKDLTSLEVQSYTGTLEVALKGDESGLDWEKLLEKAKAPNSKLKLALATKIDLDGDATQFQSSDPFPESLRVAHAEALRAGQQVRSDIATFFKDLITDFIK